MPNISVPAAGEGLPEKERPSVPALENLVLDVRDLVDVAFYACTNLPDDEFRAAIRTTLHLAGEAADSAIEMISSGK